MRAVVIRSAPGEPTASTRPSAVRPVVGAMFDASRVPGARGCSPSRLSSGSPRALLSRMPVPGIAMPEPYPAETVTAQASPSLSTAETWAVDGTWAARRGRAGRRRQQLVPVGVEVRRRSRAPEPVAEDRPLDLDDVRPVPEPALRQLADHRREHRPAHRRRGVEREVPLPHPPPRRGPDRPGRTPRGRRGDQPALAAMSATSARPTSPVVDTDGPSRATSSRVSASGGCSRCPPPATAGRRGG